MTLPLSQTPTVGLGRFINESRFEVPSHQRDYSWIQDYVEEFARDIEEAIAANRETYFCGLMVFTSISPVTFRVLDGQQRLATTLMIFSAVRNWFATFSEYLEWRNQVHDFLGSRELGSLTIEPRLSLTAANNDAFRQYVIEAVPINEMVKALKEGKCNDRSVTLVEAAIWVNRYIVKRAGDFSSPDEAKNFFLKMLKYIEDKVQIVRFVLSSDDAAYTIFETLNDRGLALSPLDLVKNYLFSHAEKYRKGSLQEFEGRWTEMMTLLNSARADSFLRAFWASRYGKPEGAKLYTAFKETHKTPDKIYQISLDMRRDAERYAALFSSTDPTWSVYSPKLRQSVDALGIIGLSQAHPIVLSALEKFAPREMERLLWLIECIAVRYQLIGRKRPGRVESLGGRVGKEIFEGRITTATQVFGVVRELYVPDEEFKLSFELAAETSSKKVRYLLAGIERESITRDNGTLSDELTPHNVTVEHIFPRSPTTEWRAVASVDPAWDSALVSRLGNLCLLPGINQSLGNKPWADKAAVYARSRLNTTNKLQQYPAWGREQIVERQKHMAEYAVSAWRFQ